MAHRTRIPEIGERGRTFGGEFEVLARDPENVTIRWVDDGATAEFDASVFHLVLESYARAAEGDDDLDMVPGPDAYVVLGSLEDEAEDSPCPLCTSPLDASCSCDECGSLECPTCSACDCMLVVGADSSGRAPGRM